MDAFRRIAQFSPLSPLFGIAQALLALMPTKFPNTILAYVIVSVLNVPVGAIFPYIHGRNKRMALDFTLGFLLIFLANGWWVFFQLIMVTVFYFLCKLPIPRIPFRHYYIEVRTIVVSVLAILCVLLIEGLYLTTRDDPQGQLVNDFFFNTIMIVVMKVGYLSNMYDTPQPNFLNWLTYCFTVNGSLSGMGIKYSHWDDWVSEKYLSTKVLLRRRSLIMVVKYTLVGLLACFVYSLAFDPLMDLINTLELTTYNKLLDNYHVTNRVVITIANILTILVNGVVHRCTYYAVWYLFWAAACGSQESLKPIKTEKTQEYLEELIQDASQSKYRLVNKVKEFFLLCRQKKQMEKRMRTNINDCFSSSEISNVETDLSMAHVFRGQSAEMKDIVPLGFVRDKNIDFWKVEKSITMTEIIFYWNRLAAKYWRVMVFKPLLKLDVAPYIAIILTNTISALWHGGQFGFVTFFWSCTYAMLLARPGWKRVRPGIEMPAQEVLKKDPSARTAKDKLVLLVKNVYDVCCHLVTKILICSYEPAFILLDNAKTADYMRRVKYFGYWLPLIFSALNAGLWHFSKHFRRYAALRAEQRARKVNAKTD